MRLPDTSHDRLAARARDLRLLLLDVDGVLTDGSINLTSSGTEWKSFYVRDGAALAWARRAGLEVGLLSGRTSRATARRAAELGITIVIQGETDKRGAFERLLTVQALEPHQVAYMGDDLLDLPVLERVGLSAAPADACEDVRRRVHFVSQAAGGRGAVREFIEVILRSRGDWDRIVRSYLV